MHNYIVKITFKINGPNVLYYFFGHIGRSSPNRIYGIALFNTICIVSSNTDCFRKDVLVRFALILHDSCS